MTENKLTKNQINLFKQYLTWEEKSASTVEKYIRDVRTFAIYAEGEDITKDIVMAYKKQLVTRGYAVRSINSMLASINCLLKFWGKQECRVKTIKQQKQTYCSEEKELTKAEYIRLLNAAERKKQLRVIMQTICSTGIRVSELQFFTVENIKEGEINISCKGKVRRILIPGKLRKILLDYAKKEKIYTGMIFMSRKGKRINRSAIWAQMKSLCSIAGVNRSKVFPHNLRKLFAKTFYKIEKDIAKLADILGHSSIDTTRIYIMTTGAEHRQKIERLGLVIKET